MNHARTLVQFGVVAAALAALGCDNTIPSPVLASGQLNVTALASDGTHVYWATGDGFVRRAPTASGPVEEVARGIVSPAQLALDTDFVYWTASGGVISRAPKAGGAVDLLVENEDGMGGLQVGDGVYWLRGAGQGRSAGQVRRAPKMPSAAAETLFTDNLDPGSLALSGAALYYPTHGTSNAGDGPGVRDIQADVPTSEPAGMPPAVAFGGTYYMLATSGASVCASGIDPSALAADPNTTQQAMSCAALDGSGVHVVAGALDNTVVGVAIDDTNVYFATADGAVSVIGIDGTAPPVPTSGVVTSSDATSVAPSTTQLGGAMLFAQGPPGGIALAVDDANVYWAHAAGDAIFSMPKF